MRSILPGQIAVKANASVCFILIGLALWILRKEDAATALRLRLAAKVGATIVSAVGLLSLLEFFGGWNFGIDQMLFKAAPEDLAGSVRSGLMAPIGALGFLFLGLALLLLDARSRPSRWCAQLLPCAVAIASLFGILDFVLDPNTTHTHISPVTSFVLLLSFGLMFARSQSGLGKLVGSATWGGRLTRRLLPAAILVPLVFGWLRWRGEMAGFFSEWTGLAMMTVLTIVLLASLTVWTGDKVDGSERELRQREENGLRLASIVSSTDDGIVGKTLDGIVTSWNGGAEKIYGYAAGEAIGRHISFVVPPEQIGELAAMLQRVREGQQVQHHDTVRVRKSGQLIDVSLTLSPIKDQSGTVVGASTIVRDISERKRAEEKVRTSEEQFRLLLESTAEGILGVDLQGNCMFANPSSLRLFGYSDARQIVGQNLHRQVRHCRADGTPLPEAECQVCQSVKHSKSTHADNEVFGRADGSSFPAEYWAYPMHRDGKQVGAVIAIVDITERKRAEEELRLNRERLDLAQKAGHSGTFDWDMQNNINIWTPEVEAVHGLATGEFGGKYEDWEALVLPEDLPAAKAGIQESLNTGEFAGEWRIRRRSDGEIRWILARAKVIFDEAGKPRHMLGLNMDVTERKQAEEEVRRLNEELEQRVIRRTAQLEAANKELEAFTYSVSHDLRAPLRHISGFSKLLMEEFAANLPPDAQHHLQRIEEGTHRMGLLVDDLLNLARVGRRDLTLQVTGLKSIVDEVVESLKPDLANRQVEWKIGDLRFVECDAALMKQVFQNLLSNALKFTQPRAQAVIEIGQKAQDDTPVTYIRDNGVGFSMKYADKLFGVFQRLHRAEDFEGTGVGLATVQRIIQKHGGRIWAEAELDKGASFYFTLGKARNEMWLQHVPTAAAVDESKITGTKELKACQP